MLRLDHITVAALTLAEGVAYVERTLEVPVPPGGRHPLMGTHNHLLRLGDDVYLEVIAPDPSAGTPPRTRWFALDDPETRSSLAASPRLLTWMARTEALATALETVPGAAGSPVEMTRGHLRWLISVPDDGLMPFGGAFPTLIQWPAGEPHPARRMAEQGCALERLTVFHPQAREIASALAPHFRDERVAFRPADAPRLEALIRTPTGLRKLA